MAELFRNVYFPNPESARQRPRPAKRFKTDWARTAHDRDLIGPRTGSIHHHGRGDCAIDKLNPPHPIVSVDIAHPAVSLDYGARSAGTTQEPLMKRMNVDVHRIMIQHGGGQVIFALGPGPAPT